MDCVVRPSIACFSDCASPSPEGKATAVGGEPGITKAVLTRIQVLSPRHGWLGGRWPLPPCALLQENFEARESDLEGLLGFPFH